MLARPLGRTGRTVSPLGFGGRALGPMPTDDRRLGPRDTQKLLADAIELGVDLVDVSPAWGDAEALAGETIRELRARDRVALVTTVDVGAGPLSRAMPPAGVQWCVERSLRATRLEVLPLVLLGPWRARWWRDHTWPELHETLHRMIREGKVLAWGALVDDPDEIDDVAIAPAPPAPTTAAAEVTTPSGLILATAETLSASGLIIPGFGLAGGSSTTDDTSPPPAPTGVLTDPLFTTISVALSLDERRALDLVARARTAEVGVLARRPLDGGALARRALPPLPRDVDGEVRDAVELALRFVVDEATCAVVGVRTRDQLDRALACADGRPLSTTLREAISPGD